MYSTTITHNIGGSTVACNEIVEFPPENPPREHNTDPTIKAALLAHIEFLEAENTQLKATRHEDIQ